MPKNIYGGISGIQYNGEDYHLGDGIIIRKVFAHLFSPYMMAFRPPGKYKHHDGPWKAAKGGVAFDILVEVEIPVIKIYNDFLSQEDLLFLIVFLIKISSHPYASLPVISDISFADITASGIEPNLVPYETKQRMFALHKEIPVISDDTLIWIKQKWKSVVSLIKCNIKLLNVFKALESASTVGSKSSSMMLIWGAIEQLFSTNGGELKFRVSANLACFLEPAGPKRLELFSQLKKLYDQRSTAAHTVKDIDEYSITQSYIHLRNSIIKIIENNAIPTLADFEESLFSRNDAGAN